MGANAEPQSPRDLTPGAAGFKIPKVPVLNEEQSNAMPLVNVHFHLGAEHKSEAYKDDTEAKMWDEKHQGRRLATDPRPGFMCADPGEQTAYTFKYCKGVEVGKTYEVHYVHSSAGYRSQNLQGADADSIADGLGGAANGRGLLNPMITVQGQVFQITNDGGSYSDLLHGWQTVGHDDSVMYAGSTTGPSHNNEICSPFFISWHVDRRCHKVSPASFDNLCRQMKEVYGLESDLYPHGSRMILDPQWVVPAEYVFPLE